MCWTLTVLNKVSVVIYFYSLVHCLTQVSLLSFLVVRGNVEKPKVTYPSLIRSIFTQAKLFSVKWHLPAGVRGSENIALDRVLRLGLVRLDLSSFLRSNHSTFISVYFCINLRPLALYYLRCAISYLTLEQSLQLGEQ